MNLNILHFLYINSGKDFNIKDYYSGGMVIPERNFSTINYRFGWNTQEKVDEISGAGNHYTAMFWEYDNRVNRRWNMDPKPVSWESQYAVNGNNPILFNDPNGDFKTKFGANLYAFFTGGTAFEDEGGEWGVEKNTVTFAADQSYELNSSRSFDWGGRSKGKDLKFEAAKQEWLENYEQQQQIDQLERDGLWDKTLTPDEAKKNTINIAGTIWLPNLILRNTTAAANVVKSEQLATNGASPAYQTALAGGKHSGFLKNYLSRSTEEINKAINTLQNGKRGINTHLDKIANPTKYVPNWNSLQAGHQQSLISGWQKEITNASEQIQILMGILGK